MPQAAGTLLVTLLVSSPVLAQWEPTGGAAGDFRAPDRPIGAPALTAPDVAGFPSSSADSLTLLDSIGPKSSTGVLKQLDKDLATSSKSGAPPPGRPGDDHKPGEHLEKRPAAPATIK